MSTNELDGHESIEPRTERALCEAMTVLPEGGDVYTVVGQNGGGEYRVDTRESRCTCPDHKHRGAECKHLRRVAFATGERAVPDGVEGVDELLGEHVDGQPQAGDGGQGQAVATDGGEEILVGGDDGELLDEGDGDGRPDDCDCGEWNQGLELPCWPCYREDFKEPAGVDEE